MSKRTRTIAIRPLRRGGSKASDWLKQRLKMPAPDYARSTPCGLELFELIREENGENILLAFSLGKDSIAAWIALRDYFEIQPFYQYMVPGLEFIEESIDYYERLMKRRIFQYPHPILWGMIQDFVYQPPERCRFIEAAQLPEYDFKDMRVWACQMAGWDENTMYATGVRAYDAPYRRLMIRKHGPITRSERKFHAIWDWSLDDIVDALQTNRVKLPASYRVFGSSFDTLTARYLVPMRKHYPQDFKRLLDWFPLADLVCFRYDKALEAGEIANPY